MSQFIDLGDPKLQEKLKQIPRVEGFCLMVDIVGSTEMKNQGEMPEWVLGIASTFNHVRSWVEPQFLKTVGDMLMFWFKSEDFRKSETPPSLLQGVADMLRLARHEPQYFQPLRAALCYCRGVYEISFMRDQEDVYGTDIDLAARLLIL